LRRRYPGKVLFVDDFRYIRGWERGPESVGYVGWKIVDRR
jgi:hypothetical protein